jgi:hypothetical protein
MNSSQINPNAGSILGASSNIRVIFSLTAHLRCKKAGKLGKQCRDVACYVWEMGKRLIFIVYFPYQQGFKTSPEKPECDRLHLKQKQ